MLRKKFEMVQTNVKTVATVSMIALAGAAGAQLPQFMWDGGMKHVLITFDGANIGVELDPNTPGLELPLEMRNFGDSYNGNASVLDDTFYSSQFGFLAGGFITLPQGTAI
ncbi:MAG: hypothetical protein AAFO89_11860, partial [Planctomycetota bacterium]